MTDKCPNPTLVPMTPSLVTRLALMAIKGLDRERDRLRLEYIDYIVENVKRPGKRFWHKDVPFTRAQAEHQADLDLARGRFYGWRYLEFSEISDQRYKMLTLIRAAKFVATGQEIWVDLATASMLARYE